MLCHGALRHCLHFSSTQEAFSKHWPLIVMRQCRRGRSWGNWRLFWLFVLCFGGSDGIGFLLENFTIHESYGGKVTDLFCLSLISRIPLRYGLSCFRNFIGFPLPSESNVSLTFRSLYPSTLTSQCYLASRVHLLLPIYEGNFVLCSLSLTSALCSLLSPFHFQGPHRSI